MAYFEYGTNTGVVDFLSQIATFAAANGWTIDYQASARVHLHKNGLHFELVISSDDLLIYGCTGYDSGAAASAQPGVTTTSKSSNHSTSGSHYLISTANALYFTNLDTYYNRYHYGVIGEIADKLSPWSGGQFLAIGTPSGDVFMDFEAPTFFYYDGQWWGAGSGANATTTPGALMGNENSGVVLSLNQPSPYNLGIMPVPITLFRRSPANTSLLIPLGYMPGLRMVNGGNVYECGEEITIEGESCVFMFQNHGYPTWSPRLLFTLGA